jgi:hypothetical protein
MPDVQELFRMATESVRPDPGALERQHRNQRWRVAKQKAGVYALAAGLVIAGVVIGFRMLREGEEASRGPETVPGAAPSLRGLVPTVDGLAGIWIIDADNPLLVRFSPDGSYAFDNIGSLDTDPAAAGTYEVTGRIITFTNGRSRICPDGDRFGWRAGLTEDGRLHVLHLSTAVVIDDIPDDCDLVGESTWTRVSPSSPAGTRISAKPAGKGAPPSTGSALRGIWLLEGGGHLLRFGTDGTYALDDRGALGNEPDDVGTFEVDGRGGITLTSGADSRSCAEDDQWIWEQVRLAGGTLRGVAGENACPNDIPVEMTWIRLSP